MAIGVIIVGVWNFTLDGQGLETCGREFEARYPKFLEISSA